MPIEISIIIAVATLILGALIGVFVGIAYRKNIAEKEIVGRVFSEYQPSIVINLAAQAGVRYSITNPDDYVETSLLQEINKYYDLDLDIIRFQNVCVQIKELCLRFCPALQSKKSSILFSDPEY